MKKNLLSKIVAGILATAMSVSIFTGCSEKSDTNQASGNNVVNKTKPDKPKVNTDKVLRLDGGWPKPPLYQGNHYGQGSTGSFYAFGFEGLLHDVRSIGAKENVLAESVEHKDDKTIVKLRKNVKWHDGTPFTSKDVWAQYILDLTADVTKYVDKIETPDENTVVFTWLKPIPFGKFREDLLAKQRMTIPYHIYKKYADDAAAIYSKGKKTEDVKKRKRFGFESDAKISADLNTVWQAFIKDGPKLPIGTGAYKIDKVTETDMILTKFKDHWAADKVDFERIEFKQLADDSTKFALLREGKLDMFDGTPAKDLLDSILAANKDLVQYKIFDPASYGVLINSKKKPLDNVKFRQALAYIADKTKIREMGNYYGKETTKFSALGMPPSLAESLLSSDTKLTDFTHNTDKAEALLKEIGWKKGDDGKWQDEAGKTPDFTIGVPSYATDIVTSCQVYAEQLTSFGIPTKVKAVEVNLYFDNRKKGEYDLCGDYMDVCWGATEPWNALNYNYGSLVDAMGLKKQIDPATNKENPSGALDLKLPGADGNIVDVRQAIDSYPTIQDENERKKIVNDLIYITNENAFAINFFQNVTGTWLNTKNIDGKLPMEADFKKYDRNMPMAENPEDIKRTAETNIGFNSTKLWMSGEYWAK